MIIKNSESKAVVIGDTSRNKVSIDINNINFITTLLSSNLYSNPLESFYRETISNAWDSHVEAHKENTPVIINIKDYISIRDYGVGLSPERFNEIYLNIGSSTKRADNTQIGGFGIGRFSALACSDVVSIKSFYEGKLYNYLMIKEGNNVNIDLVNTVDTKEPNGVEVSIPNNYTNNENSSALEYLAFFPNIYIKANDYLERLNDVKIKHYNNFAVSSVNTNNTILLGNVSYPLNEYINGIKVHVYNNNTKFKNSGIAVKFNIGELEVTPNRENIIYSEDTINIINKRFDEVYAEIMQLYLDKYDHHYDNISDIFSTFEYNCIYLPLLTTDKGNKYFCINSSEISEYFKGKNFLECRGKYYGELLESYLKVHELLSYIVFPNIIYLYKCGTYLKGINYIRNNKECKLSSYKWVELITDKKLGVYARSYITDLLSNLNNINKIAICKPIDKSTFTNKILETGKAYSLDRYKDICTDLISDWYDTLQKNKIVIDLTSKDFEDFKEEERKKKKEYKESISKDSRTAANIKIEIYPCRTPSGYYVRDKSFTTVEDYIKWVESLDKAVLITNKKDENKDLYIKGASIFDYYLILVNKQFLKYNSRIRNYVPLNKYFSTKNPKINRMRTYYNLIVANGPYEDIRDYHYLINNIDIKFIAFIEKMQEMFIIGGFEIAKFCIIDHDLSVPEDEYATYCFNKYLKYRNILMNLKDSIRNLFYYRTFPDCPLYPYLIMKNKLFRISYSSYKMIKNQPLLKNI